MNCAKLAEYERDGWEAKLPRANREESADAFHHVKSGITELQLLENCNSSDLQKHMVDLWVKMSQHLSTLLAKRVVDAREDQAR